MQVEHATTAELERISNCRWVGDGYESEFLWYQDGVIIIGVNSGTQNFSGGKMVCPWSTIDLLGNHISIEKKTQPARKRELGNIKLKILLPIAADK